MDDEPKPYTYQWFCDGVPLTGHSEREFRHYRCRIRDTSRRWWQIWKPRYVDGSLEVQAASYTQGKSD